LLLDEISFRLAGLVAAAAATAAANEAVFANERQAFRTNDANLSHLEQKRKGEHLSPRCCHES